MNESAAAPRKAIVVGASSGIGRALSLELGAQGYEIGLMARRQALLEELSRELNGHALVEGCDISQTATAMEALRRLIQKLGGLDLIILCAGTGHLNPDLDWGKEQETITVNALAFAALANVAFAHFSRQGRGHLVGISSIAALTGNGKAPAYNASKAFPRTISPDSG